MKTVTLSEAKANLDQLARECSDESIVITVDGKARFELMPIDDDDIVNDLIEHNVEFQQMLESRKNDAVVSSEEARKMLGF